MAFAYLFLAEGFEEVEALTTVDLLRRAGIEVKMTVVGAEDKMVTGSHGITVLADILLAEVRLDDAIALILPGGMPGTKNLEAAAELRNLLTEAVTRHIRIGAICAAPSILGHLGLLKGKRAVCYPGFEKDLEGAEVLMEPVAIDGTIITSRGVGTAIEFALALITAFKGAEKAESIAKSIVYNK